MYASARFIDTKPEKRVILEDGRELFVPSSALEPQPDGSFYLRSAIEPAVPSDLKELPSESGMPKFLTRSAAEQLYREDCDIRRVPVKRIIEAPVEARYEGDVLIVPMMEEVLVVEKRLMLREELHITRRRQPKAGEAPIPLEDLETQSTS